MLDRQKLKTCHEIGKLQSHISQGCLSGIQEGDGTEWNEPLHRLLNRSFLCGVSILGPELADVLLPALLNSFPLFDRSPYEDSYVHKMNKGFKLERFSNECLLFYFTL